MTSNKKEKINKPNISNSGNDGCLPLLCKIRIMGHLNRGWEGWFEVLKIINEKDGNTVLTGLVADQSALYGLIKKVRDSGMTIISVNCFQTSTEDIHATRPLTEKDSAHIRASHNKRKI